MFAPATQDDVTPAGKISRNPAASPVSKVRTDAIPLATNFFLA
jgi:hypothetical protein